MTDDKKTVQTLKAKLKLVRDYVKFEATCRCCERYTICLKDCTFAKDAGADFERMQYARKVLRDSAISTINSEEK